MNLVLDDVQETLRGLPSFLITIGEFADVGM